MNRKYTIEEYTETCKRLRESFDDPAITTDIIVGFPGETEEDFNDTVNNLTNLELYEIHVFKYSRRKGTVADKMPDQVDEKIKNQRSDIVLELTSKQKKSFEDKFINKSQDVLVEEIVEIDGKKYYRGHTTRYVLIDIPFSSVLAEGEDENKYINELISYTLT